MAVFIVLWSYLLTLINKTTKLRSVICHNLGHSIAPILFTNNAPIPSANEGTSSGVKDVIALTEVVSHSLCHFCTFPAINL